MASDGRYHIPTRYLFPSHNRYSHSRAGFGTGGLDFTFPTPHTPLTTRMTVATGETVAALHQATALHQVARPPSPATSQDSQAELLGGSALKRLHFKSARKAHTAQKHRSGSPVPKVIVMGSSTASDKTINTSTDSAATALTSITGTDDSLDADHHQEPVQSSLIDATSPPPSRVPNTAPPGYHRNGDPLLPNTEFGSPAYTKPQSATNILESPRPGPARFIFDIPIPSTPSENHVVRSSPSTPKNTPIGTMPQIAPMVTPPIHLTPKSPKMLQSKLDTLFKFDRPTSPGKRRGSEPRVRAKQKREELPLCSRPEYKGDFFIERQRRLEKNDAVGTLRKQLEGAEVFHSSRRKTSQHSIVASRRKSTTAQVHVTANPLDSGTTSLPSGRTTIVVQQPSLSLDYGGCATMLLRDSDETVGGRRRSKAATEHLQQLLDVTSQFTSDDLHEFDKRYGSPHHCRSQSVKAVRGGERQLLGLPQQRARVASMPNTGVEEEYYRLRHFSITGKGVVNRGDSLRSRRSRSNTSVASSASSTEHLTASRASAPCSRASSRESSAGLSCYRVLVLGGSAVGKSSLIGQFMTSEYLHAYDTSIDDESGERSVCVLLDSEESEITFLDGTQENAESSAHGYCVVYSTADRASLGEAESALQRLWSGGHTEKRAVILVGNKSDLARSRAVPNDEGKALAISYDCKFIETSVSINHNVDELLVGLLTQIRLKQLAGAEQRVRDVSEKRGGSKKNRSKNKSPPLERSAGGDAPPSSPAPAMTPPTSAQSTPRRGRLSASLKVKGLLGRVWARDSKSKSCENLHVL